MNVSDQERKLTTILSADVVGYSTLMNKDESATLSALQSLRASLIEPKADQYHGRTIKLMGDGALMEFSSVVDAVSFAVDVQHKMADFDGAQVAGHPVLFRIGINIGDVIVDGDDIYGDGVNIAARLEKLADPGGICVSRTVVDHIDGKLELDITALGERRVKNIPTPIDVHKIELNERSIDLATPMPRQRRPANQSPRFGRSAILVSAIAAIAAIGLALWQPWNPRIEPASIDRMVLPLPDRPSLVVLPFDNFNKDPDDEYFADGMTEDLITDLSKISGIFVISRNSSWTYKNNAVKSQQIAEELGVQYILEGSVRREGDQVRVNAQLIDALAGHHIWADRYDSQVENVFSLQDDVIHQITSALAVQLTDAEQAGIGIEETTSSLAYDKYLNGLALLRQGSQEGVQLAIAAFDEAIEIDPGFHRAYAGLAAAHWRVAQSLWLMTMGGGFEQAWESALKNIAKASERPSALSHSVLAEMLVAQGNHEEAFKEIDKALALAPNDPSIHLAKAKVLNATGRAPEAEAAIRFALRYDPLQPTEYLRELGVAQLHQKKYLETVSTMRRVLQRETDVVADIQTLVSALGHLDQLADVPELIRQYDELAVPSYFDPFTAEESEFWWYGDMFSYDPAYRKHLYDGLVKAGVPHATGNDLDVNLVRDMISREDGVFFIDDVPRITVEEARDLWKDGSAVFIDVRAVLDFNAGHIPGSKNLSLQVGLSKDSLLGLASREDTLIFSCHGPHCPYSAYGAAKAKLWGFTDARYFPGGFPAWQEAGLDIAQTE
jgi:adenylate cyclase